MFERPERATRRPNRVPTALRADGRVTLVAEAAQGFEGDLTLARLLVRAAAEGGADLVKFQVVYADELTTPAHHHHQLFADLEMPDSAWQTIADDARREGVGFACDVFGQRSLRVAVACGAAAVKIHASDVFNDALVDQALTTAPHVYLSLGGIRGDEIDALLARLGSLQANGKNADRLTLLYGFQAEPTRTEDNHLARLGAMRHRYPRVGVGFMDHTDGDSDESGWLAAVALPYGIRLIEKHISLDPALEIEDYVSALAPAGFASWSQRIRAAEAAIGHDALTLTDAEEVYRRKALKVVVATRGLDAGAVVGADAVTLLRTPMTDNATPHVRLDAVLGRRLTRAVAAGAAVCAEDLE